MASATIERYPAVVTSTEDPEQRGRIRVACAAILGDEDSELPDFVEPALDWGWFTLPDVGETIELEVNVGSETDESFGQSSIDSLDAKWRGARFYGNTEGTAPTPVHEDFKVNYGKRRGFATPNGHILWFDDTPGKEKIQLTWKQGDTFQYVTMDETGSTIIANKNGSFIHLDAENKGAKIIDENGNLINMTPDGITIIDKFSNVIEMKDGVVQVLGQSSIILSAASLNAKVGSADIIDGADTHMVRGEDLLTWINSVLIPLYNAHVQPTALGPTGPPAVPLTPPPATVLSLFAKVK